MKKFWRVVRRIFIWLIAILAIATIVFTCLSAYVVDRPDRSIFGYQALTVTADNIDTIGGYIDDLLIVKDAKYENAIVLPTIGLAFPFLKSTPGYIVGIFLPFLALLLLLGYRSICIFRNYKAEQLAEIEAERRRETEEMAAERKRLKEERLRSQEVLNDLKRVKNAMEIIVRTAEATRGEE